MEIDYYEDKGVAFLEGVTQSKYLELNCPFKIHFIKASVHQNSVGFSPNANQNGIQIHSLL